MLMPFVVSEFLGIRRIQMFPLKDTKLSLGFSHDASDHSLFIYDNGNDTAYTLLYANDIILTFSSDIIR